MTVAYRPSRIRLLRRRHALAAATALGSVAAYAVLEPPRVAHAQFRPQPMHLNMGSTTSSDDPATFQADKVDYDDNEHTVTWSGNVQVWQGDHVMRADKIVYDRDTGVVAARGHVATVQPDGSVIYAHYAELTGSMKDGIMLHVNAVLPENAKLAANGMRRTGGKVNDMSRAVYTACEICAKDKTRAPFWQFRAYDATQDLEHQRIDFRDAYLDILGIPVLYLPYFSMTDPSAKRHSGFLMPGITPHDRYLGTYFTIPYYWVIDDQSDVTVQGLFSTKTGPQISAQYRNRFNFGSLNIQGGLAYDTHRADSYTNDFGNHVEGGGGHGVQGYIFANAQIAINKYWRAGANVNLATSADYMRDYRIQGYGSDTLNSNAYLEGFGTGSYSRLDGQFYQGLNQGVIRNSDLPFVLPRYEYSFLSQPDAWGGRFSMNTNDFNVRRTNGTSDQRGQLAMNWDRPFRNRLGQQFLLTLHLDSMVYRARKLYQQPNYYQNNKTVTSGQVLPTIALKTNWPFVRTFEHGRGTQIVEPIVQGIYAPNTGTGANDYIPNEDSMAYEFTDSTLFSLNRYQGTDRLDGGLRGNVGIHANWTWDGHEVDLLAGESFQEHITHDRIPYSGLDHHASDVVMRARVSPNQYFDFNARMRLDPYTTKVNFGDALFSAGVPHFRIRGGYIYEPVTPYYYYATNYRDYSPPSIYYVKTSELSGGFSTDWANWHLSGFARRSLSRKEFVSLGGDIGYNNDCFGIDFMYLKQYTSIGGQQRNSTYLFTVSLKTLGAFGLK
ncbi:organic solvent tolerance protein [Acetobacter indonesiensis NRIC 0313]|uniref:LPS-assembly protein LptD n=1 Tax=Acetobacter indonesiensis TaxID=104101 RepID=A0A6N3T056_9PROT|nr:organic solvent tolerance protein [Acetobacter indonesiensis]GBQ56976.1 organic solvent tolerance protein [Acetobacter indonesiensis NRIC 0313]GEN02541.1 LPS-assembly protein LptD [Acetobacter indonesiensis]